jgi:carbonic anhydrase
MTDSNTDNLNDWLKANEEYQKEFAANDLGSLPHVPQRLAFILTCIDCRLNPFDAMGLKTGEYHIFRNAGGRVTPDAIRSFSMTQKLMGTKEIYVMHHTKCGVEGRTDAEVAALYEGDAAAEANEMVWYTCASAVGSVKDDVELLMKSKLIAPGTIVAGLVFHVETGAVTTVVEPQVHA